MCVCGDIRGKTIEIKLNIPFLVFSFSFRQWATAIITQPTSYQMRAAKRKRYFGLWDVRNREAFKSTGIHHV